MFFQLKISFYKLNMSTDFQLFLEFGLIKKVNTFNKQSIIVMEDVIESVNEYGEMNNLICLDYQIFFNLQQEWKQPINVFLWWECHS